MANFAKLNSDNIVMAVHVVDNDDIKDSDGVEQESLGIAFFKKFTVGQIGNKLLTMQSLEKIMQGLVINMIQQGMLLYLHNLSLVGHLTKQIVNGNLLWIFLLLMTIII